MSTQIFGSLNCLIFIQFLQNMKYSCLCYQLRRSRTKSIEFGLILAKNEKCTKQIESSRNWTGEEEKKWTTHLKIRIQTRNNFLSESDSQLPWWKEPLTLSKKLDEVILSTSTWSHSCVCGGRLRKLWCFEYPFRGKNKQGQTKTKRCNSAFQCFTKETSRACWGS